MIDRRRVEDVHTGFDALEPKDKIERLRRLLIATFRQQQLNLTMLDTFREMMSIVYAEIGTEKLIPQFEQFDRLMKERLMQEHHNWSDLEELAKTWIREGDFV